MTAAELAALAEGSITVDRYHMAWQKSEDGLWYATQNDLWPDPEYLVKHFGPITLIHDCRCTPVSPASP